MADVRSISINPEEALAFFRAKKFKLDPSFDWRDWKAQQHAGSFTVAKSAGFDILADIFDAVEKAIAEGTTLQEFQRGLIPVLQEKGWWGKKEVVDPLTGETKLVQLGSPRRLKTIFQTNLRMAYMAGKWQRFMRTSAKRPWLRYVSVLDNRTRITHRSWHGTILRFDDPWWTEHFPPNDFGCRCDVQQLSDADLKRYNWTPSPAGGPQSLPRTHINRRTGEVTKVPQGIMPGFEFNVGQLGQAAQSGKLLMDRLAGMEPGIATQAGLAAQDFALSGISYEFQNWAASVLAGAATGSLRVAGQLLPQAVAALSKPPPTTGIAVRAVDVTGLRDSGFPLAELLRLPHLLARPDAILLDTATGELCYVYTREASTRLMLRLAFGPVDQAGLVSLTRIAAATLEDRASLAADTGFKLVSGHL